MLSLGALSFATPWALAALAALPVIWWLLRVYPPAPKRLAFTLFHLLGLKPSEETPVRTPPWLLLLRLTLAALIILAIAQPILNPSPGLPGNGPMILVIDDDWSVAHNWRQHVDAANQILDAAARERRAVIVATTTPAPSAGDDGIAKPRLSDLSTPAEAKEIVAALQPHPWHPDYLALSEAIADADLENIIDGPAGITWLGNDLVVNGDSQAATLMARLQRLGPVRYYAADRDDPALALLPPDAESARLKAQVIRPNPGPAAAMWIRATAADGRLMTRERISFADDAAMADIALSVPIEVQNEVVRIEIEGHASAGAVVLMDERWRRRPVGLISGGSFESGQPLLSDLYYLERALSPFHEIRRGSVSSLLESGLAVLILADFGRVVGDDRAALENWVERGGVLVRFAGPRLAEGVDDFVPVKLRVGGGRALGGALSWDQPMPLRPFADDSPFAGLAIPDDVLVERQVLAEPALDLDERTWARLGDGTPLVTAVRRGQGQLILFHITANTDWSNLAISGLFVDMLKRIVDLSVGVAGASARGPMAALEALDGFGVLEAAPATARPLETTAAQTRVGPTHPPGFYGHGDDRQAVNLSAGIETMAAHATLPSGVARTVYGRSGEIRIGRWLLVAAFVLALIDMGVAFLLRGEIGLPRPEARQAASSLLVGGVLVGMMGWPTPTLAQAELDEQAAVSVTQQTRLAYVVTGDPTTDQLSQDGLVGLSAVLRQRTAVEPGDPVALDIETDDLAFYPLLYWPVIEDAESLTPQVLRRVDDYLRTGGMIVFDTRDQSPIDRMASTTPQSGPLSRLLNGLNIPPLTVIPSGHALTQAFYLLDSFPGRWNSNQVWVERYEGDINDGVSSVIIGGNDWAGAWAVNRYGEPLMPVVPGGERQREFAYRVGVNLAMYALTGNYKADQVHIPSILRRLGQDDDDTAFED